MADRILLEAVRMGDRGCMLRLQQRLSPWFWAYFQVRVGNAERADALTAQALRAVVTDHTLAPSSASLERSAMQLARVILEQSSRGAANGPWCDFCLWIDSLGLATRPAQDLAGAMKDALARQSVEQRQLLATRYKRNQSLAAFARQQRRSLRGIRQLIEETWSTLWRDLLPDFPQPDPAWLVPILEQPENLERVEPLVRQSPQRLAQLAQWMELEAALLATFAHRPEAIPAASSSAARWPIVGRHARRASIAAAALSVGIFVLWGALHHPTGSSSSPPNPSALASGLTGSSEFPRGDDPSVTAGRQPVPEPTETDARLNLGSLPLGPSAVPLISPPPPPGDTMGASMEPLSAWRYSVFQAVYTRDADQLARLLRQRARVRPPAPPLLTRWAHDHFQQAHRGVPLVASTSPGESLPLSVSPLLRDFPRELYDWVGQFEAALEAQAWDEAQRLMDVDWNGLGGLAPLQSDPDLLVSVRGAILRAHLLYPALAAAMETRQADAAAAIQAAMVRGDRAVLRDTALRYLTMPAAAQAWGALGMQALSWQRAAEASGFYQKALFAAGDKNPQIRAQVALAVAAMGHHPAPADASGIVWYGGPVDPEQFRDLLTQSRTLGAQLGPAPGSIRATASPAIRRIPLDLPGQRHRSTPSGSAQTAPWALTGDQQRLYVAGPHQGAAVDAQSGKVIWNANWSDGKKDDRIPQIAVDRRHVLILPHGRKLVCLDKETGQVRWTRDASAGVMLAGVAAFSDRCYVVAVDRQQQPWQLTWETIDPATGHRISRRELLGLTTAWQHYQVCEVTPWLDGCVIQLGGAVATIDFAGNVYWARQLITVPPSVDSSAQRQPAQSALVDHDRIYSVQPGVKAVTCLDMATGRPLWQTVLPDVRRWVAHDDKQLIVQEETALTALSLATGEVVWRRAVPEGWLPAWWDASPGSALTARAGFSGGSGHPVIAWWQTESGQLSGEWTLEAPVEFASSLFGWQGSVWTLVEPAGKSIELWQLDGQ
jgi:outer membrane protein assembly factor BamB